MNALRALFLVIALSLLGGGSAFAVSQVPPSNGLTVDVWINKEEGGVYRPGESMRVYFRASADAYVLVYNIDTEGYIHLVYPYGPADPSRVEGGRTYRIPSRHDPYDLVADGPQGMEFVVAVASPVPFQNLPWYLAGVPDRSGPDDEEPTDALESGQIVGDPYVAMEQLHQRIIAPSAVETSDATETYFYLEQRVEYPRYVCADCHYSGFGFDPYLVPCPVVSVRIDATWVRYAPVRVGVVRPRYYYYVRSSSPTRYRAWKERWSTLDGTKTLRSRFVVEQPSKPTRTRETTRSMPPEFRNLRRDRPGRLWQGRDQVLRLWEKNQGTKQGGSNQKVSPRAPRNDADPGVQDRSRRDRGNAPTPSAPSAQQQNRGQDRQTPKAERKRDSADDRGKGQKPEAKDGKDRNQKGKERSDHPSNDRGGDRKEKGPPPKTESDRRERGR